MRWDGDQREGLRKTAHGSLSKVRRLEPKDCKARPEKKAIKASFKKHHSRAVTAPLQSPQLRFSTRQAEEVGRELPYLESADTDKPRTLFEASPLPALRDDATSKPAIDQRLVERVSPSARIGKRRPGLVPPAPRSYCGFPLRSHWGRARLLSIREPLPYHLCV